MLKTILSISGKPGLYKLVSNSKNMVIVESLIDNKKLPIHTRDKVVSLGDISIYTEDEDMPLKDILLSIQKKEANGKASIDKNAKSEELKQYFAEIVPNFDRDRVYPTDIKKIINWYNLLVENNIDFSKEEEVVDETKANDK